MEVQKIKKENNEMYFIYLALVSGLSREANLGVENLYKHTASHENNTFINDALAIFSRISNITIKGLIMNAV